MAELLSMINNIHYINKEESKIAIKVDNIDDYIKFVSAIKINGGFGIEYDSWENHKKSESRNYKESICIRLRHMLGNTEYCDENYFIDKGYKIYDYRNVVFDWEKIFIDRKTKYNLSDVINDENSNRKIAIRLSNKEEYETLYNAVKERYDSLCMSESKFFDFNGRTCINMTPRMAYQCETYHYMTDGYTIINISDIVLD